MATQPKGSRLCRIGSWSASIGLLLLAFSAGHKLGFLDSWQIAFAALALSGLAFLVGLLTAGLGLIRSGGSAGAASPTASWFALLVSMVMTGINLNGMRTMGGPPIHDITTDLENPPMFVAAIPVREAAGAANPPMYFAAETAPLQARAYPDIKPIMLPLPPSEAFARVEAAAKELGWEIIAAVPGEGRLEATATTNWIGFRDDVVVRVTASGNESRVDVRSKSRVGRGDAGLNARRIRAFRDALAGD